MKNEDFLDVEPRAGNLFLGSFCGRGYRKKQNAGLFLSFLWRCVKNT